MAGPSAPRAQPASPSRWPCVDTDAEGGVILSVQVQPQARRSQVNGLQDGALRIRLAAPAIEGRANVALVVWLAGQLGLRQRDVVLLQGERSRRKRLRVTASVPCVESWLARVAGEPD